MLEDEAILYLIELGFTKVKEKLGNEKKLKQQSLQVLEEYHKSKLMQ
jgi:hypothetical protein